MALDRGTQVVQGGSGKVFVAEADSGHHEAKEDEEQHDYDEESATQEESEEEELDDEDDADEEETEFTVEDEEEEEEDEDEEEDDDDDELTCQVDFNGAWRSSNETKMLRITGKMITWHDGDVTHLRVVRTGVVEMLFQGCCYIGELRGDGKIHWNDGDVWTRHVVGFDGPWISAGDSRTITISNDVLTWHDGDVTQLRITSDRTVEMTFEGSCYSGELRDDDKIHWTDGDSWSRHQEVDRSEKVQALQAGRHESGLPEDHDMSQKSKSDHSGRHESGLPGCDVAQVPAAEWQVLPSVDAFPGMNVAVETMSGSDIQKCRGICRERGHGGFVVFQGTCYFRAVPAEELLRVATRKKGCCLHIRASLSRRQELFNGDVASKNWQARLVFEACGDGAKWRDLRATSLQGLSPKLVSRMSQLGLLRRLRLDPCRALDYAEIAECLEILFTDLDFAARELLRQCDELQALEKDASPDVPVADACEASNVVQAEINQLQQAALIWKASAQSAALSEHPHDLLGRATYNTETLPVISFSSLATFLEKALASKDGAMRRLDVLGKILQCAKEESRKKMMARPASPIAKQSVPNRRSAKLAGEFRSAAKAQNIPLGRQCDVCEAVFMVAQVLMGPSFDSRESLAALMALKHLIVTEPDAVRAARTVSGLQRALCHVRSGMKDVPTSADESRHHLAAEIEKACFDSQGSPARTVDRSDFSILSHYPVGATFTALDCLHANDEESPESKIIGEIPTSCLCCVLAHGKWQMANGRRPGSSRLLLQWEGSDGRTCGWVSFQREDGNTLLHQEWPCDKYLEELSEPLAIPRLDVPSARTRDSPSSQMPTASGQPR